MVRLRLVGGRVSARSLRALVEVADRYGDGRVHVTSRANLQVRGLPGVDGQLAPEALAALEATGLLPTRTHELIRNLMVSPATGLPVPQAGRAAGTTLADSHHSSLGGTPRVDTPTGAEFDSEEPAMVERARRADACDGSGQTAASEDVVAVGSDAFAPAGRADLRAVAARLDDLLCADPRLAELPGRFLFVLDDGSGDLITRECDLGLVALDAELGQLRVGPGWGPVVPLASAAEEIVELARRFLDARGTGPSAAWHVAELPTPLPETATPDPRLPAPAGPLPYGEVPWGQHVEVPSAGLDGDAVARLLDHVDEVVVTPWRGILVPRRSR